MNLDWGNWFFDLIQMRFFLYFYVKYSDADVDKSIENIIVNNLISFLFIAFN